MDTGSPKKQAIKLSVVREEHQSWFGGRPEGVPLAVEECPL